MNAGMPKIKHQFYMNFIYFLSLIGKYALIIRHCKIKIVNCSRNENQIHNRFVAITLSAERCITGSDIDNVILSNVSEH